MTEVVVKLDNGATTRANDMGGYLLPTFPGTDVAVQKQMFDDLPSFPMRDDDVMLCSFPKTGTNWMFELLSMMLNKSAQRVKSTKFMSMMEAKTRGEMESLPSPRVMNCHMNLRFLPEDLKKKGIKTILVLRNPKDAAVSRYHHTKGLKILGFDGDWKDFVLPYTRGELAYGKYADYLREWQEAIGKGVGFPLHVLYYEDLKLHGEKEIDKLEKFLELDLGAKLKKEIMDACQFEKMKVERQPSSQNEVAFKNDFQFFRKGQVGDWKNYFTVRQNEVFDEMWAADARGLNFAFKFTDPRQQ